MSVVLAFRRNDNETDRTTDRSLELSPAVLELTQKPASPVLRAAGLTSVAMLLVAVSSLWWGHYDVVAIAGGKVVPKTREKIISAMEIGSVRAIRVEDGQMVKQGDPLIELDPTIHQSEIATIQTSLNAKRLDALEAMAMLAEPEPQESFETPADIDPQTVEIYQRRLKSRVTGYASHIATMRANLVITQIAIDKISATLPILRKLEAGRKLLVKQNNYPETQYLTDLKNLIDAESDLRVQQATADRQRSEIQQTIEEFKRDAAIQRADAERQIGELQAQLDKAKQLLAYMALTAPVDGVVEQLAVHTAGGVVQPGNPLMIIIPDGDQLQVEALITQTDIGFVRPGQSVVVKFDTYPFEMYGYATGTVETLSNDSFADPTTHAVTFPARITLDHDYLPSGGAKLLLTPGMNVSAEIKTTQRRLIDWFAQAVLRIRDESFRER